VSHRPPSVRSSAAIVLAVVGSYALLLVWGDSRAGTGHQGSRIVALGPRMLDLGALDRGEEKEFQIVLRNQGSTAAVVRRVWSSCGCTTAALASPTIAPGGEVSLDCRVDTSRSGERTSELFVQADDGIDMRVASVRFAVRSGWTMQANPISLHVEESGADARLPISLTADSTLDPATIRIRSDVPGLRLRHEVRGRTLSIFPETDRDLLPRGRYLAVATIESNLKNCPAFRLGIEIDYASLRFQWSPAIPLGELDERDGTYSTVLRVLDGTMPMHVDSAASLDDRVRVLSVRADDNGDVHLKVELASPATATMKADVVFSTTTGHVVCPLYIPSPGN